MAYKFNYKKEQQMCSIKTMHKIVVQNDLMFWDTESLWNSTEFFQSQEKKFNEFDYVFRVPICVIKGRAEDKDERKWPPLEELKKKRQTLQWKKKFTINLTKTQEFKKR